MKFLPLTLLLLSSAAHAATKDTYGIHLFFSEKEYVDVLTVTRSETGILQAHMSVPNDFEADVTNLVEKNGSLIFDLPVPKNASRPTDLLFHYEGRYFDDSHTQLSGFVTLKGEKDFVASFLGFRR